MSNRPSKGRILHFTPGFRYGGIESLLMGLYKQLDHTRFQFDFIVDYAGHQPEFDDIRQAGGRVYQFSGFKRNPISYLTKFTRILNKYDRRTTAFHVHDPVRGMPLLRIAKTLGFQTRVLHSHSGSLDGTRLPQFSRLIAKYSNEFATQHMACSRSAGEFLFGETSYSVFKNPIDVCAYQFDSDKRSTIRRQLSIDDSDVVVGHTGRFSYPKNHEWITSVFANFAHREPNAVLLLVGEGERKQEIKDICKQLGIIHRMRFVGRQSDIAPYLSAMDLFFMPSHFEGLGISLIEAQACGLPCLVSDVFPKEAFATNAVLSLNLAEPSTVWSAALFEMSRLSRFDSKEAIQQLNRAGFDVRREWLRLLDFYGYKV